LFLNLRYLHSKNKINNQKNKKMKITLNRVNENYHFELKNERGHIVNVDNRSEFGDDLELVPWN
jgi:hypothetical protein